MTTRRIKQKFHKSPTRAIRTKLSKWAIKQYRCRESRKVWVKQENVFKYDWFFVDPISVFFKRNEG